MREAWVGIVEQISFAVDGIAKMIEKLAGLPTWFQNKMNQGATAFMNLTTSPESRAELEATYGISSNPTDIASQAMENQRSSPQGQAQMADARARLATGLNLKLRHVEADCK